MHSLVIRWTVVGWAVLAVILSNRLVAADDGPQQLAQKLDNDLADGTLDAFSLFEAASIAGGVTNSEHLNRLSNKFDFVCRSVAPHVERCSSPADRLNALHKCLHRELLIGTYHRDFSEVQRALESGDFNCVSATVLLRCLCKRFGVECHAVASADHVLCSQPNPVPLYIETTCRDCRALEMSQQPERIRNSLKIEQFRVLTDVQLLGKIYYNRGLVSLESRCFEPAVAQLKTAWRLDPCDHSAKENLLAALNNWALHECAAERFEKASELIAEARSISPEFPPVLTNDLHVHQRWVRHLCEAERFAESIAILESGRRRRPDAELFRQGPSAVMSLWAQSRFVAGDLNAGWSILDRASREQVFDEPDALAESAVCDACRELVDQGDLDAAKHLMSEALQRLPAAVGLLRCQHDLLSDGS